MTVKIYGASDDLIEVEGDIVEEFDALAASDEDGSLLALSDGTVLRIRYGPDVWRITPVARGTADLSIEQAPEDDEDNYSDVATLSGPVTWVVHGVAWAKAKGVSTS